MTSLRLTSTVTLLLALSSPLGALAAQEPDSRPTQTVRYEVHYLNDHAATALAWEQCEQKAACRIVALSGPGGRGAVMDVIADAATQEKFARVLAERDVPRTQKFQLVLLAASPKPNGAPPTLAPGAQKALDDIREFLPFKSYRILDASLIRVTQDDVAQGRIAGLGGTSYKVGLRFRAGGVDGKKLVLDGFGLDDQADHDLIQTSFAMDVGETVVVGTSTVSGSEEALVAILTAVP
ncbi:MAG TPA: hypothetical protein VH394_02525 [Thermoanaerobaculia bacterium]|jgi:hypothetical protein|nr:hypothetical protein [Thermoanaerobaculia bacterium]